VDHEVDLALEGRTQSALEVREKVVPPAASLDARAEGKVEAEVGVGDEEQANCRVGHRRLALTVEPPALAALVTMPAYRD
jgi:hypothetical protein